MAETVAGTAAPTLLRLPAIHEPHDRFEIHLHLVTGRARPLAARFNFSTFGNSGSNGVGQLTREPVYHVIHRTAPFRGANLLVHPQFANRLGPSAFADA